MKLERISKGIAGAVAGATTGIGTTFVAVPPEVNMPWWGYIGVGLINAVIGFGLVYVAPRNRE